MVLVVVKVMVVVLMLVMMVMLLLMLVAIFSWGANHVSVIQSHRRDSITSV